jgi:outer membrane protein TolC
MRVGHLLAIPLLLLISPSASAQSPATRSLSLEEALRMGQAASERTGIARAGVLRARGQLKQARSEFFPQLDGSASYTRTLASQFSRAVEEDTSSAPPPLCRRFTADPTLPVSERLDSLESALECASLQNPFAAFKDLPFGRENQYNLGLKASQVLYAGGRIAGRAQAAAADVHSAEIALESAEAQTALDITQAYYDAVLADRLLAIADSTLRQAERTYDDTKLGYDVGNVAEFDLLRARVARDNARPAVISARSQRDVAYLRLKQLLEVPLSDTLALETLLGDASDSLPPPPLGKLAADTGVDARASVRQAVEAVNAAEGTAKSVRGSGLPEVKLTSTYARLGYPDDVFPSWSDFVNDWTVSLAVTVPLFTGGRISGQKQVARADVDAAKLRLKQARELAALDNQSADATLAAAEAAWAASAGVVSQAQRAYEIAELRYREGLSTQTELGDARVQLQQALANRAQSARDLQVARVRNALLGDLPLALSAER